MVVLYRSGAGQYGLDEILLHLVVSSGLSLFINIKIFRHMLKKVQKKIELQPFPHFVMDNFLEENEFLRLSQEFPSEKFFQRINAKPYSGGRMDFQKGDPLFHEILERSPAWKELFEKVNSQSFFTSLLETFGEHIINSGGKVDLSRAKFVEKNDFIPKRSILNRVGRRVYRDIGMRSLILRAKEIIHPDEFYILFNIGWSNSRYYVGSHTDNRFKAIIIVVYFDDFPGEEGALHLLERKTPKSLRDCERYPPLEEIQISKVIYSKANRCVGFVNCNNAYHSTVPWFTSQPRRLLVINLCKGFCESMWDSSYFERGETPPRLFKDGVEPLPEVPIGRADNVKILT